ncbi:MAG TPA: argininosuccinate lyase [Firmicutes bacterium]|nr:argininosuccinate lyase [Bacillota bacterium]
MDIDMRERLNSQPLKEVAELLFRPAIERDFRLGFGHMMQINKAHVVMLADTGIIPKDVAARILIVLESLEAEGLSEADLDPSVEDLHFNIERLLIERTGPEVGGRMHTGRSRNDLHATLDRMIARDKLNDLLDLVIQLRGQLLTLASRDLTTVMTGYTHLQPAQPITFGHYMCALASALERDTKRLEAAYETINQCPLGAGALAGTGFPIDREITADLLGFDGILENSLDAVASRDWVPELLAALSIMMTDISRLSMDLYLWYTDEFSYIDLDGSVAAVSSIMPQKKNPITLEHCKSKAAHVYGALISSLACLKNVPFGHSRDVAGECVASLWNGLDESSITLRLMSATLSSLRVRSDIMAERAARNFSTATELADTLVRECDLPFRVAHMIVASLVSRAVSAGLVASDITAEMLDEVSRDIAGRALNINPSTLKSVLAPERNVEVRDSLGGPATAEVRRMVSNAEERLKECRDRAQARRDRLDQARARLSERVRQITGAL